MDFSEQQEELSRLEKVAFDARKSAQFGFSKIITKEAQELWKDYNKLLNELKSGEQKDLFEEILPLMDQNELREMREQSRFELGAFESIRRDIPRLQKIMEENSDD